MDTYIFENMQQDCLCWDFA